MGSTIAIDFGTTNTIVAEWVESGRFPETIFLDGLSDRLQNGPPAIPSLVYVDDVESNTYYVGFTVLRERFYEQDEVRTKLYSSMKRDLLGDKPFFARSPISSERAAEIFLDSITRAILTTGRTVSELVLTTPVMAFERYSHWLARAVCGLHPAQNIPIRIIDEPTAAAFGYGIDTPGGYVLVIDFGGGTLDLSLVRLPENHDLFGHGIVILPGVAPEFAVGMQRDQIRARVIAKSSCGLGGDAIDETLVDYLLEKAGATRSQVSDDLFGLKKTAEEAKKTLSTAEEVYISFYFGKTLKKMIHYKLTRVEFEQYVLNASTLDASNTLHRQIDQILKQAESRDIGANQVGSVLLVGGSTLIPAIRTLVEERFGSDKIRVEKTFEAVAHGALCLVKSYPIDDILHHSYALEVKRIQVIKKASPLPQLPSANSNLGLVSTLLGLFGLQSPSPTNPPVVPLSDQASEVQSAKYDYMTLLPTGTVYPLETPSKLSNYLQPSQDGTTQLDFVIAEIQEADTPGPRQVLDSEGQLLPERGEVQLAHAQTVRLLSDRCSVRLDPPGKITETERLAVSFTVDENRHLRLTVEDLLGPEPRRLLFDEPVVKLE